MSRRERLPEQEIEPLSIFDPESPETRLNALRNRLRRIDQLIADAVAHHLFNPPELPRDELMALPGR